MRRRSLYAVMSYADVRAAAEWLAKVYGFEVGEISEDGDGRAMHAELRFDDDMLMLGALPPGRTRPWPEADDWRIYVAVDDPDALHDRVVAAGGEITMQLTDQPYGSREFGARDLEGNIWSFGTYRP